MTKDELKAELGALGVEYPKEAKLADLEALYAPYSPAGDQGAEDAQPSAETASETPEATQDEIPAEPANRLATVNCKNRLNLRDAPGGQIIGEMCRGQEVEVLEEADGWTLVQADAWVMSEFLA